jgi:lipopolysaccharide export system permease protein
MNLLDRYILGEWLKMLGLLLAATMGLLFMAALYDNLRDLIEAEANAADMMLYYATFMPSYFNVVLPLSMLLSLLFVLSKLHRNNEITAIRAAGLNIFATTRSLWLAGIMLSGVSFLLNARVVPWSVEASRSLLESFELRAAAKAMPGGTLGVVTSVTFDNRHDNRMWFMNRYSRLSKTAYGVMVSNLDHSRREVSRILAREGSYDPVRGGWTFTDGREIIFDPELGEIMRTSTFTKKSLPNFNEDPMLMLLIDRRPGLLSFNELRRIVKYFAAENNPKLAPYEFRYYGLLFDTLGPLIVIAIAIPFAVSGTRVSPAVGVSKSIGLFLLFYVLSGIASFLGGNGYLEPIWAAAMPNLAMIGLAAWLFGRLP